MIRIKIATLVSIALFAAAAVRAQETPFGTPARQGRATSSDPFLDELVLEALQKNPELTGALSSAEAALSRIEPARTLPDPFLSLNYQNDGKSLSLGKQEMTFLAAMFLQPLPWPGKLRLAGEEAQGRAEEVREGTVGRALLSVEARVRRAYYDYLLAKAQLELIEDRSRPRRRERLDIVRERYVGIGVQQDVQSADRGPPSGRGAGGEHTAQVATRRGGQPRARRPQETAIRTSARLTFIRWCRIAGAPSGSPRQEPRARGRLPGYRGVAFAGRDSKEEPSAGFVASGGPMYRGGLDPRQVGLGITLPIFAGSRQRPLIASAEADVRTEEARASSTGQELEFRTRERFENLTAIMKIARVYGEGVLPVGQLSLESAIASYRTGKVPFITVLEALNSLYADRSIYLTRLAEAEKVRVAIDEADLQASAGMSAAVRIGGPAAMASTGAGFSSSMR